MNDQKTTANRIRQFAHWLLPNGGTILVALILIATQSVWAKNGATKETVPNSSTNTISYQGQLTNTSGTPLNGDYDLTFRLYNVANGGTALWTEQWIGANNIAVTDGLFHVMLGSLASIPQTIFTDNPSLWLGVKVGADNEMTPRVQLGSVPFAIHALTVPDSSITTANIQDGAVTSQKMNIIQAQSYVATQEFTTSTTFIPLTTPDVLTFTLPSTQWVYIEYLATTKGFGGKPAYMILAVDGGLPDETWISNWSDNEETISGFYRVQLSPGNHTVALLYRTVSGGQGIYWRRKIIAFSLGQ